MGGAVKRWGPVHRVLWIAVGSVALMAAYAAIALAILCPLNGGWPK